MAPGEAGKPPIYLDYNGTTPVDREVCEAMTTMMYTHWGNPSSSHYYGVQAKRALEGARRQTAELIGAQQGEITFMSNGTETINHCIKGLIELGKKDGKNHVITQVTEHVAVLEVCRALERSGCSVTYLPVDSEGLVAPSAVEAAITPRTICVSIMHSNNETGALQPIKEIVQGVRKAAKHGVFVHCDASQSLGKLPVDVDDLGVDFLTIAGHKVYAPKGVGALYMRSGTVPELPQLIHGAGQEGGRRASTENVVHIVGLGKACEVARRDLAKSQEHLTRMRDRLEEKLKENLGEKQPLMRLNGPRELRLPNTLNVSFHRVEANTLLSEIADSVAASAGAACHSDEVHMSHVLEGMGVSKDWAMGTCRFTVGRSTTEAEVDAAAAAIAKAVARLMPSGDGAEEPEENGAALESGEVKLTRYTHGMGCACKLRPQLLEKVLAQVREAGGPLADPNVLAGLGKNNEDACVYRLTDEIAVVGTLDFFTPIVDDPEAFGAVAAANALSDVYAMGAKPLFALNIVGFPSNRLAPSVLAQILKGGQAKCAEAGVSILGGHTVDDTEPKYGLAVVGLVHPEKVWRNNGVVAGDSLILTKPLGTGILSTAAKRGALEPDALTAFLQCLQELNDTAADCGHAHGPVHGATDVTGFGLLGHLVEMLTPTAPADGESTGEPAEKRARKELLGAVVKASSVPLLPGARELAGDDQCVPGGTLNNLKSAAAAGVAFGRAVTRELQVLLADAQTSGGLLLSVPSGEPAKRLLAALHEAGLRSSAVIGEVVARRDASEPLIQVEP